MKPFISICIPAYKNASYLDVLLRSIELQVFRDFEVVVSDDSPDDEVEKLCNRYQANFKLVYHKNKPAKGSPANWNIAIGLAKGYWIKIMHDDDWFADEYSLAGFAKAAQDNPAAGFIFSECAEYENGKLINTKQVSGYAEKQLRKSPLFLFSKNHIGQPSVTLIKNNLQTWYDERTKWVVDFEFYIRCLQNMPFHIVRKPLINIGINKEQITKAVFTDSSVLIPENLYLLEKMGTGILKKMTVYDHYWRLFRNMGIRDMAQLNEYADGETPQEIKRMLQLQFKIPLSVLRIGIFSKIFMGVAFYRS